MWIYPNLENGLRQAIHYEPKKYFFKNKIENIIQGRLQK